MKIRFSTLIILICFFNVSLEAQEKKAIFIIVDGIPTDVIEKINTPNLDAISKVGAYARAYVGGEAGAYSETKTISANGYNSLLTATWSNKHNVLGNSIKHPNYNYWNIFRISETHKPKLKTAIFSTWLDNRTKLVGEGLKDAGAITFDYAFDGFEHDTINFPHDKEKTQYFRIDEHVSKETEKYIIENSPDLSWVYLEFTDSTGHLYGDSPQFYSSVEKMDTQIGRIWNAIKMREKSFNEDWMIVITTDHGRSKDTGKDHGGQSLRERATWLVTNHKNTNGYFENTPGIVDVVPSVLRHLEIDIPTSIEREMDGISFIEDVVISNLEVAQKDSKINLSWKSYRKNEKVSVYVATTNHFKTGGKDVYKKVLVTNSKKERATIDVKSMPSKFYKILVESSKNSLNKWIIN